LGNHGVEFDISETGFSKGIFHAYPTPNITWSEIYTSRDLECTRNLRKEARWLSQPGWSWLDIP
jgi:hypothetical protein